MLVDQFDVGQVFGTAGGGLPLADFLERGERHAVYDVGSVQQLF